ncbi:MAG: hypothetical protein JWO03_2738 [Bacteroidetes bacterium]|nr:hypothetical protein [Bacteroidota bacterium]
MRCPVTDQYYRPRMKMIRPLSIIFCFCFVISGYAQSPNDTINPDHFNYELVQSLYLKAFNSFRADVKAPIMQADPILQRAAQDQAAYCMKINLVTHNQQDNDRKYDVKDHVSFYHGNHSQVAENALMTIILQPTIDPNTRRTTAAYTYEQLASKLLEQWKNSPRHYDNMVNGAFTRTGIALSLYKDKKVLYATQVFGCEPYTPPHNGGLKYSDTTWGVKEHVESKCKPYGEYDFLASIFSSYLIQYEDTIFQYYQDENVIKRIISGPRDGLAVDLVYKNQFSCPLDNNLHPSTVFDGYMMAPKYREEIFKNDFYKNGELLSPLCVIPKNASRNGLQFNTILIQNGMTCRYSYPVRMEQDILKDLPIYPQWCKAEGTIDHGIADFDQQFDIPFEKNETSQDAFYFQKLKELLATFDGAISRIEINAYSSVEGTEAINLSLQQARADFLEGFIKKSMKQSVPIQKNARENWPKMLEQANVDGSDIFLSSIQKDTIRKVVNEHMYDSAVSLMLDQQRVATIKIHLHKEYDDKTEARFMPLVLYDRIYKGDSAQAIIAYSRVINAYQQGNLDKHYLAAIEIPLKSTFLPLVNNYLASIIVQSDIFDYSAYSSSYFQYIDSAEKMFHNFKPLKFNMSVYRTHLYFHKQLENVADFKKLGKVVDSLCRDTTIEKKLRYQLEFNYYLSGSVFYYHQRLFTDMFSSFDHVRALLPLASLKAQEVYDVGRYFNYFARYKETTKLLETYLEKYPNDEDLIYLYVNTGAIVNFNLHQNIEFYFQQMEKLSVKNKPRLCKWFNENFQLLREPQFKERICQYCRLE